MLFNNNKYIVSRTNDNQNRFYIQNSNYSDLKFLLFSHLSVENAEKKLLITGLTIMMFMLAWRKLILSNFPMTNQNPKSNITRFIYDFYF